MASNINLKNNLDTTLSITHSDGSNSKVIDSLDMAVAIDTVADFPANPNNGDVVIVRDLNRGGTFIYDSTEVANSNDGTNFNGWIRQYSGAVNVKWFGAVGDGVTDDTFAIQLALDSDDDITDNQDSTYKITSPLTLTKSKNIKLGVNTVIDGRSIPAATIAGYSDILKINGSKETAIALSANSFEGQSTYTLSSVSGLNVGDYILITSDAYHSSGVTAGLNKQGWITQIQDITSLTVTVTDKAYANMLTTDNAKVEKLNMLEVNISGGKLLGSGVGYSNGGIRANYLKNSTINGMTIEATEDIGIALYYSINTHIDNMIISDCTSGSLGNTGYGIVFASGTSHSSIRDSRITNCRHSIAGGGTTPVRHITVDNNITLGCGLSTADLDCHEPCYYWNITNNSITPSASSFGGIIVRGKKILIEDNKIYGGDRTDYGVLVNVYYDDTSGQDNIQIKDNFIVRTSYGVRLGVTGYATPLNKVTIDGNHFIDFGDYAIQNELDISDLVITNNIIKTFDTDGKAILLTEFTGSSGNFIVSNNDISITEEYCIQITDCSNVSISNNLLKNTGSFDCLYITGGSDIVVNGNQYMGAGTFINSFSPSSDQTSLSILNNIATIAATGTEDFARVSGVGNRVIVSNNICAGTFRYGVYTTDRNRVIITNNVFEGNTHISAASGATTSIVSNNIEV